MQLNLPFDRIGAHVEKRSAPSSWDLLAGKHIDTEAGVPVSPHLAENLSAVFAGVQIISQTVATLSLVVYRLTGDGVEAARAADPNHPVARLFSREPNSLQTATEFLEMTTAHCLLRGNGYAEIVRDGRGAPVELIPMHPDHVSVMRIPGTRRVVYDYSDPITGGTRRLLQDEVLHLKDRSDDGIVGKSRLQRARETFGTALAVERHAGATFRNGATLSGVLSHPDAMPDEAHRRIQSSFRESFAGSRNAGKIAVLEEGMKFQPISMTAEDAEMLASRKFGVEQISRLYQIPPPILGDLQSGNYSAFTELARWFHGMTIRPWLQRWESTIERALFSEDGRRTHVVEFDTDELLRGDYLQRLQGYRIGREIGLYSANDLRRFESLNPRTDPDGDSFLAPLNMAPEQKGAPKDREPVAA